MKINVADKELDLKDCLPLTIGDWAAFETAGLIDENGGVSSGSAKGVLGFMLVLLQKIDPEITEADIGKIPLTLIAPVSEFLGETLAGAGEDPTQDGSPS
jgi:hypothetical protein